MTDELGACSLCQKREGTDDLRRLQPNKAAGVPLVEGTSVTGPFKCMDCQQEWTLTTELGGGSKLSPKD